MGAFVWFDQVKKVYRMGEVEIEALRDASFIVNKGGMRRSPPTAPGS